MTNLLLYTTGTLLVYFPSAVFAGDEVQNLFAAMMCIMAV